MSRKERLLPFWILFALGLGMPPTMPAMADEPRLSVTTDDGSFFVDAGSPAERTYLGVRVEEETESDDGGARVTRVVDGSPAAAAGIRAGDVLVRFGEQVVHGPVALTRRIHEREPGDTVAVVLRRDGDTLTLNVELGRREIPFLLRFADSDDEIGLIEPRIRFDVGKVLESLPEIQAVPRIDTRTLWSNLAGIQSRPTLGVQLVETTPELREHLGGSIESGVLVSKVLPGRPAAVAGIEVGDLILSVDGTAVADVADLRAALAAAEGRRFAVELSREGRRHTVEVQLDDPADELPTGPQA